MLRAKTTYAICRAAERRANWTEKDRLLQLTVLRPACEDDEREATDRFNPEKGLEVDAGQDGEGAAGRLVGKPATSERPLLLGAAGPRAVRTTARELEGRQDMAD